MGFDGSSYAYRDVGGSSVHKSIRNDDYGQSYGNETTDDIVGMMISIPRAGAVDSCSVDETMMPLRKKQKVTLGKNTTIRFFLNGIDQGVAYTIIDEGDTGGSPALEYFPALSLYGQDAHVRVNFGQTAFQYPPSNTLFPDWTSLFEAVVTIIS